MELGSGIGGIALIVLAVIWLLVFVPGWARKSQITSNPELVSQLLSESAVKELARSSQLQRLMRTRRIFSLLLFSSLVIFAAWFAVPMIAGVGSWIALVSGAAALLSLTMLIAANRTRRQIAVSRIAARNAIREKLHRVLPTEADSQSPVNDQSEISGWDPNPLPTPLSAPKVGALITPKFADVIPIKAQEENSEPPVNRPTIELDEILRRRRVI